MTTGLKAQGSKTGRAALSSWRWHPNVRMVDCEGVTRLFRGTAGKAADAVRHNEDQTRKIRQQNGLPHTGIYGLQSMGWRKWNGTAVMAWFRPMKSWRHSKSYYNNKPVATDGTQIEVFQIIIFNDRNKICDSEWRVERLTVWRAKGRERKVDRLPTRNLAYIYSQTLSSIAQHRSGKGLELFLRSSDWSNYIHWYVSTYNVTLVHIIH